MYWFQKLEKEMFLIIRYNDPQGLIGGYMISEGESWARY